MWCTKNPRVSKAEFLNLMEQVREPSNNEIKTQLNTQLETVMSAMSTGAMERVCNGTILMERGKEYKGKTTLVKQHLCQHL